MEFFPFVTTLVLLLTSQGESLDTTVETLCHYQTTNFFSSIAYLQQIGSCSEPPYVNTFSRALHFMSKLNLSF